MSHNTSSSVKSLKLSAIKRMTLAAKKHPDPIFLSWGRPDGDTPLVIKQYAMDQLKKSREIGKYTPPHGLEELRYIISTYHKENRNVLANPNDQIIVTAGAMEAMFITMQTLINPGDEIIMTSPGFTSYIQHIKIAGGNVQYLPLSESEGWDLDVKTLSNMITDRTKAIILTSPNNPTGSIFSKKQVKAIVEIAKKHEIYVISDEIYDTLIFDDAKYFVPSMLQKEYDRIISIYSLSKRYHMTGWRVGYIVAESNLIKEIVKVHDAATICASTPSQVAAIRALQAHEEIEPEIRSIYAKRRKLICKELDTLPSVFEYVNPQGAYYIFPKILVKHDNTEDFAMKLIEETGVATVPGDAFGPDGKGHLRMAFCISEDQISEAFKRLRKYFT